MTDERMNDLLRVVGQPADADPVFLERLYGELAVELGFRRREARPAVRQRRTPRRWLLAAAMLMLTLAGSALVAGTAVRLLEDRSRPDMLEAVRGDGVLHAIVGTSSPQARPAWREELIGGFDIDVAEELARRMELVADVRPVADADMLVADDWQLAFVPWLPSTTTARYLRSAAIYYWPVHVVLRGDSAFGSLAELDGTDICVVTGSSGEAWLASDFDGPSATFIQRPPDAAAVTSPDDESCLDALAEGSVAAIVTADLGPAELAVRGDIRVLGGPVLTEERGAIVDPGWGDVDAFLDAVDAAIEAARADGTLTDLARSRFGGHDLSAPPSPIPPEE